MFRYKKKLVNRVWIFSWTIL